MGELTDGEVERYSRHILLKHVGLSGQHRISAARVLVIGAGGLGSPVALYLAAAGIGTLGIADHDRVELSNLQRQVLHGTDELGQAKTESAIRRLEKLNPGTTIVTHGKIDRESASSILPGYQFVIDASDGFENKFLINDSCVEHGIPFCHAGVVEFTGQAMTVIPGVSACYRCVFAAPPPRGAVPTSAQAGVLGPLAGLMGAVQAIETIKFLVRAGDLLTDSLMVVDALSMGIRKIAVRRDERCRACGGRQAPGV